MSIALPADGVAVCVHVNVASRRGQGRYSQRLDEGQVGRRGRAT